MIHSETHLSEYDRALQQDQDMEEGNPDPHPGGGHHGGQFRNSGGFFHNPVSPAHANRVKKLTKFERLLR